MLTTLIECKVLVSRNVENMQGSLQQDTKEVCNYGFKIHSC